MPPLTLLCSPDKCWANGRPARFPESLSSEGLSAERCRQRCHSVLLLCSSGLRPPTQWLPPEGPRRPPSPRFLYRDWEERVVTPPRRPASLTKTGPSARPENPLSYPEGKPEVLLSRHILGFGRANIRQSVPGPSHGRARPVGESRLTEFGLGGAAVASGRACRRTGVWREQGGGRLGVHCSGRQACGGSLGCCRGLARAHGEPVWACGGPVRGLWPSEGRAAKFS